MKRINAKWLIVAGGVLLSAVEALSNLVSVSDTAIAVVWSRSLFAKADQHRTFDVLTYNVAMGPLLSENRDERALLISKELGGHDVVLLQGAHSEFHRKVLLTALEDEYPHQSRVLGQARLLKQDGGVVIVSKWPIERQRQRPFDDVCNGTDCLADGGVLYARINRDGQPLHVFATCLQSGAENGQTREDQLRILRGMIDDLEIPADELVLIGGTLNVDRFADERTGAFTNMLIILNAAHPPPAKGGSHEPTLAPNENPLAHGRAPQHLDYLLYSEAHLRPLTASSTVQRIAAEGRYLSDHYAVSGHFVFGSDPDPATAGRSTLTGIPVLADTATLRIDGQIVRLLGVDGVAGAHAQSMAGYIGKREVTCRPVEQDRYHCVVDGKDLSEVVLFNGGGQASPEAPPELIEAERHAREQSRGIWSESRGSVEGP